MLDFITDNIFIVVIVVVVFVVRMVGAARKRASAKPEDAEGASTNTSWEDSLREEEPDTKGHWETSPAPKPVVSPAPRPSVLTSAPLGETDFFTRGDLELNTAFSPEKKASERITPAIKPAFIPIERVPAANVRNERTPTGRASAGNTSAVRRSGASAFANLNKLSPLKKAVVMSEILSEPKALKELGSL